MPDLRRAEHAGLRLRELARRLALDQIAGDGERAAAEADERLVRRQRLADDPDCLEDERHRILRLRHAKARDVVERLDRPLDHRPDVLDELDVDAHPEDRKHDVREHHGRVHPVRLDRLERHLRAELRPPADLEEAVALPDRAVAGQRAAGLAHEPDGRPLDGLAARAARTSSRDATTELRCDLVVHPPDDEHADDQRDERRRTNAYTTSLSRGQQRRRRADRGSQATNGVTKFP